MSTSDKELLERAAKSAALEIVGTVDRLIVQPGHLSGGLVFRNERGGDSCWNPLTDDGDALRLAVKMGISVSFSHASPTMSEPPRVVAVDAFAGWQQSHREEVPEGTNPASATRRAIVRAAASISDNPPSSGVGKE